MSWQLGLRSLRYRNNEVGVPSQAWNRILALRFSDKSDPKDKFEDIRLVETKPLSGYTYDEGIEGFKSKWRLPFIQRKGFFKTNFGAFATNYFAASITKIHPENFKYFDLKTWWKKEKREQLVYDQQFNEERLMILGCDLGAAHFTVYRGGAVKFVGHEYWIKDDKKTQKDYDDYLPNAYDPNYVLEAIDFSNTRIIYEGLKNIENLSSLKWLSFANCAHFDDWCLDRVSGEHRNNLEYLDISFTGVTHRGLYALYRFNKLKTLIVDESNEDPVFFQLCLEIQKICQGLNIELVSDPLKKLNTTGPSKTPSLIQK
ncbi:uncharacterized protein LOC128992235 [Macrosteles quadrilineatus]|uniref:uncharacterized protein LOC128992235 n=1 Tax=Macrosteles quadrilineatus TaxID=74068 RepID=UPI0023E197C7|nr:uncharacterized protein LOC128992235 [Macrosteles quadrilineatus]